MSSRGCSVSDCHRLQFLRVRSVIGVERTGAAVIPLAGVSRAQSARPDWHRLSSQFGSYSWMRAGSTSDSHAEAGISYPSSCVMTAASDSIPSGRGSRVTPCQSSRKRMKSADDTGSISARSVRMVYRWIRARRRRSHHSCRPSPGTPTRSASGGVNCPRSTNPSLSSAASAVSTSPGARPSDAATGPTVTGPRPCRRRRINSTTASSRVQARAACSGGASMFGSSRPCA